MKQCIAIIGMLFIMHSINAKSNLPSISSSSIIQPVQDSVPFPKWSYGLQIGYNKGRYFFRNYDVGLFAERRFSSVFAIESELTFSRNNFNAWIFGESGNFNHVNLALFGKVYFGENKRWYSKLGYKFRQGFNSASPIGNPVVFGIGHNLPLKSGRSVKLEYNFSHEPATGLIGGAKVGYRF